MKGQLLSDPVVIRRAFRKAAAVVTELNHL
jgi:hypothetical protein